MKNDPNYFEKEADGFFKSNKDQGEIMILTNSHLPSCRDLCECGHDNLSIPSICMANDNEQGTSKSKGRKIKEKRNVRE